MRLPRILLFVLLPALAACGGAVNADHGVAPVSPDRRVLRVCADPNNLPYSNDRLEGFENRIVEIIAEDLGAEVEYTWFAQRRGFIRNTLRAGACDIVTGVPSSFELALPTAPYYRSTYVFLSRADREIDIRSLDDPRLAELRIGVHLVGDDYTNTPPAHALANRGLISNVVGYTLYGDYRQPHPPANLVQAVAGGEIDLAIVWGPIAGYFAPRSGVDLKLTPVTPQIDLPFLPFVYDISMAVRREDSELQAELDAALQRRSTEISEVLAAYGVPRMDAGEAS